MKAIFSLLCGFLTLLCPFPFKPFSTGGVWYVPTEGPGWGSPKQSPVYYWFEPWGIDTILIRCVMIFIGWGIVYGLLELIVYKLELISKSNK